MSESRRQVIFSEMISFRVQSGMALAVCLIFLFVVTLLALGAMASNLLNQKMSAVAQAVTVAFNSAEAGLIAEEATINSQGADLSNIAGELTYGISADAMDDCQQHIFTIISTAAYQNARIKLTSAYLKARDPPLPGCADNQISHPLWWRQVDV